MDLEQLGNIQFIIDDFQEPEIVQEQPSNIQFIIDDFQEPALGQEPALVQEPIQNVIKVNSEIPDSEIPDSEIPDTEIPDFIFIIPYRDREAEKQLFLSKMDLLLTPKEKSVSKMFFIEQTDARTFNRGAMKNIGFLVIKQLYPNHYKNITIVFNDIDTTPIKSGLINYKTTIGIIKHFYGFTFALGGIVSITGNDFEKINGFPNYWAWGFEDNLLNKRAINAKIHIDRSQFYPMNSPQIIQIKGSSFKIVNRAEFDRYIQQVPEGIKSITQLDYNTTTISKNIKQIVVDTFSTGYNENISKRIIHDLKKGSSPFTIGFSGKKRATIGMII